MRSGKGQQEECGAPVGGPAHEAGLGQQALQRRARAKHRRRAPQLALKRVAHQQRFACKVGLMGSLGH